MKVQHPIPFSRWSRDSREESPGSRRRPGPPASPSHDHQRPPSHDRTIAQRPQSQDRTIRQRSPSEDRQRSSRWGRDSNPTPVVIPGHSLKNRSGPNRSAPPESPPPRDHFSSSANRAHEVNDSGSRRPPPPDSPPSTFSTPMSPKRPELSVRPDPTQASGPKVIPLERKGAPSSPNPASTNPASTKVQVLKTPASPTSGTAF